jgi:hypothetical protein
MCGDSMDEGTSVQGDGLTVEFATMLDWVPKRGAVFAERR